MAPVRGAASYCQICKWAHRLHADAPISLYLYFVAECEGGGGYGTQAHFAGGAGEIAGAADDREGRIAAIEEWSLHHDLSLRQDEGPGAFPGAAGDIGADAPTLIRADLLLVVRVEDRIGEDQQIAGTVAFRQLLDDGVGFGPLDDRERDHAIDRG